MNFTLGTDGIDKRNWKCFFGMHQYEIIREKKTLTYLLETDNIPSEIINTFTLQCIFCGKISREKIKES